MNQPKFTPGPWRTDAVGTHHCNTGVRILRDVTYVEGVNPTTYVITDIIYPAWCPNGTVGETGRIANAHLIAAAPEMYEALKALTTYLEDDPESFRIGEPSCRICTSGVTPNHLDRGPCAFHRAQAIIAKAEGRAL